MADNVESSAGSGGAVFATDEIGGVHFPRSKIVIGANNTNDGDVSAANPLPVTGTVAMSGTATVTGTVTADAGTNLNTSALALEAGGNLAAVAASASVLDDWDESDRAKVNVIVGQAGVTAGAGSVAANTPRVTLASDDPGVASLGVIDDWDESDRAKVNIVVGQAGVTAGAGSVAANTPRVTLASDDPAVVSLQLIDDAVVADDAAFTPGTTKVVMVGMQADESSTDSVNEGDGGAPRMTLDRKAIMTPQPHTAGGLLYSKTLDLDESHEEIKGSAGQVYGWNITNTSTATRFIKFYNAPAASITVGTSTPAFTLALPGNASDDTMLAQNFGGHGIEFNAGISWAATTGVADNDTGAPSANDVVGTVFYK